jgi:hypothetical protein
LKNFSALYKWILVATMLTSAGCNLYMPSQIKTANPEDQNTTNGNRNAHDPQNTPPKAPIDSQAKIGYEIVQKYSLISCQDCHAGKSKIFLTSLGEIQNQKTDIQKDILEEKMPPIKNGYSLLIGCEKDLLLKWLELGAPANSDVPVSSISSCQTVVTPPTTEPTPLPPLTDSPLNYQIAFDRILRPKCVKCHNPEDESDASVILFFPYNEIIKGERRWMTPGRTSKVIISVTRKDEDIMPPPPPEGGEPLTNDEIDYLIRWIDAGKPEK